MSTFIADFRSNNERPSAAKITSGRRSFLEKLNMRPGTLALHMRSKRGEPPVRGHDQPYEHTRTPSWSHEVSSTTSTPRPERSFPDFEPLPAADVRMSPTTRQDGEFRAPHQYPSAQIDREGSPDFAQGMENFMLRQRAASHDSMSMRPTYISLSGSRKSSSRGASSEMSDEQIDEWLERPVDAEVHRYRKLSAGSGNAKAGFPILMDGFPIR